MAKKTKSAASQRPVSVPKQEFTFGQMPLPEDRPLKGSDIDKFKLDTTYDLNALEATLGISRRDYYYELADKKKDEKLPDIAMAILMRLYSQYPNLLPFQPIKYAEYLSTVIGVHPGEFAQLVGRSFSAGRSWQQGQGEPTKSIQLIIEALARAGVTSPDDEVYQTFLKLAKQEAELRGETREIQAAPKVPRKKRRTKAEIEAENSMISRVDD